MSLLITKLADRLLRLPELRGFEGSDFDTCRAAQIERQVLAKKKILATLYDEYCRPCVESAWRAPKKARMLEIGSGTSPLEYKLKELITSDVIWMPWLDLSCSAYSLPFPDNSLDRIFLMFVCHHLGNVEALLGEARRCLKPGGEMVIIDPAVTAYSKIYYLLHVDHMDIQAKVWSFEGEGRMSGSNIALTWIVFFRDRELLVKLFPEFVIDHVEYNTCLSFLISGGFRIRQLLPTFLLRALFRIENWVIRHLTNQLAVTMALTIKRR